MKISEKIKEMQGDLDKYHVTEKKEEECKLEDMIMLMLNDQGYLGPGKIIGENDEYLDFMFYKREGPTFSLSIKKEQICGLSILHKPDEDEESEGDNVRMNKALYQCGRGIWPPDVLKKVFRGLSRVEAGNPGFPRLVQLTSGGFSRWL